MSSLNLDFNLHACLCHMLVYMICSQAQDLLNLSLKCRSLCTRDGNCQQMSWADDSESDKKEFAEGTFSPERAAVSDFMLFLIQSPSASADHAFPLPQC